MLRLPSFEYTAPDSVDDVLALLAHNPRARLVAGGTDLVPNLKHGIEEAEVVVSLRNVPGLRDVTERADGGLDLGAMLTLEEVAEHPLVQAKYPSLSQAAGVVAGPHHRRMGTLGGNVCLNTRCVYINQTYFWRESLGFCLKKDGELCHVVKGGKRCVAAASNDTATVLMTLGADLAFASRDRGERRLPITDFYVRDGVYNKDMQSDDLLTAVSLPAPAPGLHGAYGKLRPRNSIDFPRLSVAVAFTLRGAGGGGDSGGDSGGSSGGDSGGGSGSGSGGGSADSGDSSNGGADSGGSGSGGTVHDLRVVVSALAAVPQLMRNVTELAEGRVADEELFAEVAAACAKQCHPLTSIDGDPTYRREMVPVYVRRTLRAALAEGQSAV